MLTKNITTFEHVYKVLTICTIAFWTHRLLWWSSEWFNMHTNCWHANSPAEVMKKPLKPKRWMFFFVFRH